MERNENVQTNADTQEIPVIGFGRRLAAALIDGLILLFVSSVLTMVIVILWGTLTANANNEPTLFVTVMSICGLALSFLYYVGAWSSSGQTIAKNLLGIKVVGADGKPLPVSKAILRYVGYILSAVPLSLGFLWIAFDKKRQGWHDKIASSYAVVGDADILAGKRIDFVPIDPILGWFWLGIWFLIAILVPPALLGSLFILGPTVSRIITDLIAN